MLEIAEFASGLAVVAKRRAAGLDRLVKHVVNRLYQTSGVIGGLALFCRKRCRQPSRRQMRAKQRLADIDVAEACDYALVKQWELRRGASAVPLTVATGDAKSA